MISVGYELTPKSVIISFYLLGIAQAYFVIDTGTPSTHSGLLIGDLSPVEHQWLSSKNTLESDFNITNKRRLM
jgi:hypothetical protein